MHERTKASAIPREVKKAVYARDEEKCLICGRWVPEECACCHVVSRARLGLGCEENIVTLCHSCHQLFDGYKRQEYEPIIVRHLKSKYPGWDKEKVIYSKWGWTHE